MKQTVKLHINFTGGLVSPGELRDILDILNEHQVKDVCFGLRQQMIVEVPGAKLLFIEKAFAAKNIVYEKGRAVNPNIVSSYVAANIFSTESWLREGVYKDIFGQLDYRPKLKINICDTTQNLVPFFTGHINWLSSANQHFWYLYIRLPKTQQTYCWPYMVYTNSIGPVSKAVEQFIAAQHGLQAGEAAFYADMEQFVKEQTAYIAQPVTMPALFSKFYFPYYEGLNRETPNSYWLGIYRRDELYPVNFLQDVCSICLQTKIGQLYTTPWKSIIAKGISNADRHLWNEVLGKYRINVRHAANELNWQVEDSCDEGLVIKRNIIRHFDKEDVRTYGLTFAVETKPGSNMFGSVIIRKKERTGTGKLKSQERFDILYSKDFNPNSKSLLLYRDGVSKEQLGTYLVSLCKFYYENNAGAEARAHDVAIANSQHQVEENSGPVIYQCSNCFTVYDEEAGCPWQNVSPGTPFPQLNESFCCVMCESPKAGFIEVNHLAMA